MAYDNRSVGPLKISEEAYAKRNRKMRKENPGMGKRLTKGKSARRVSFACRFGAQNHPMKNKKGEDTAYAKALKKWGFKSAAEAKAFCRKNKKKK